MCTIAKYYRLIKKKQNGEFGIQFPVPVDIYIGLGGEHHFQDVESIRFTCDYKFLEDMKQDLSVNRPRYKSVKITKIIFKKYNQVSKSLQKTTLQKCDLPTLTMGSQSSFLTIDPTGDLMQPTCSMGTYDYLDDISQQFVNDNFTSKISNPKSGRLEESINVLIKNLNIQEKRPQNTLKCLTNGPSVKHLGDNQNLAVKKIENQTTGDIHYIQQEENTGITPIITETEKLVIGRHFTEIMTRTGKTTVLHGRYTEHERLPDGSLKRRNTIFFNNGSASEDPAVTATVDPMYEVIKRANNYDKELVDEYFRENPVIKRDDNEDRGDNNWFIY